MTEDVLKKNWYSFLYEMNEKKVENIYSLLNSLYRILSISLVFSLISLRLLSVVLFVSEHSVGSFLWSYVRVSERQYRETRHFG